MYSMKNKYMCMIETLYCNRCQGESYDQQWCEIHKCRLKKTHTCMVQVRVYINPRGKHVFPPSSLLNTFLVSIHECM